MSPLSVVLDGATITPMVSDFLTFRYMVDVLTVSFLAATVTDFGASVGCGTAVGCGAAVGSTPLESVLQLG